MSVTDPEALLLLPRLSIQNANAISSPLTWGFPSPGAFTGFVHALQRRVGISLDIELDGVGIVCHRFEAQISQPAGKRTKVFNLTRNPLNRDGSTAAIVEEGAPIWRSVCCSECMAMVWTITPHRKSPGRYRSRLAPCASPVAASCPGAMSASRLRTPNC